MKVVYIFVILIICNIYILKHEKINNRNSSLECLRILAMILVVAHHFAYHGFNYFDR